MSALSIAATAFGGLGLFLLGMALMTDGLKLAAGAALTRILAAATRTRWHALGAGTLVTALVQSSSAVTVAAIGFVNAGVLGLGPALWVLFGANVGTTMTGWIVALVGLKLNVQALALPLIGLGVVLKLTGEQSRRGAIGGAMAGFGLLFLGISMLTAFGGLADQVQLPAGEGALAVLAQLLVGMVMTMLMQSSSASIAIALTAAQGGLVPLHGAAAVVIGANIGTTVTAVLATLKATSNARRAAAAHVLFNVLTGVVALALLPWLVDELRRGAERLGHASDAAAVLALFHTTFNLLGVLLMWPLTARLTQWLQARFHDREEAEGAPRHLDTTVQSVPALAAEALEREVARCGALAGGMLRRALDGEAASALAADARVFERLDAAIAEFVAGLHRGTMSGATSERLARSLRVQRYHETACEQAMAAAALQASAAPSAGADLAVHQDHAAAALAALVALPAGADREAARATMESAYQALKAALLAAGAQGRLPLDAMERALRRWSALRRAAQQLDKAQALAAAPPEAGSPDTALAAEAESA